jgi:hypothetical protein
MATNQIKTRILNKIDSYSNWIAEGAIVLKKGEIGIAQISTGDGQLTPPAVGIKVGDGATPYAQLPWIQAIAGDVTAWCKTNMADCHSFKAQVDAAVATSEGALQESINGLISRVDGLDAIVKTGDDSNAKLRAAITATDGVVAGHTTAIGTLNTDVTNLGNNKADKTQVATDIGNAKTELIGSASDAVTAETIHGALNAAAAAANKADGASAAAAQALTDAKAYTDGKVTDILGKNDDNSNFVGTVKGAYAAAASAQGKADTNAGEISSIKEDIAEINEALGGTDGNSVSDRLAALEAKDVEHGTAIGNNADAIGAEKDRAMGVEAGFETRIATMENFWKAADDPVGTIDKLSEIVDYIAKDESGAVDMAADIEQNAKDIAANTKAINDEVTNRGNAIDTLKSKLLGTATYETDTIGTVKAAAEAAAKKADDNLATAKTYAEGQATAVLGAEGDAATAKTVYGAHAAAAAAASAASVADGKAVDAAAAAATADGKAVAVQNAVDGLLASSVAEANGAISTIGFSEGKITATRKLIDMDDMDGNTVFIFDCGTASADLK